MITILAIVALIILAIAVLLIASFWKLLEMAGKPGWAAIVPLYGHILMLEVIKKPWWWILLMLIPYVGAIWSIWSLNLFMKRFGKDEGYTVGVIFLPYIFLPLLAFSSSTRFEGNEHQHDETLDSSMIDSINAS